MKFNQGQQPVKRDVNVTSGPVTRATSRRVGNKRGLDRVSNRRRAQDLVCVYVCVRVSTD